MGLLDNMGNVVRETEISSEREQMRQEIIEEFKNDDYWFSTTDDAWIESEIDYRLHLKHMSSIVRAKKIEASRNMRQQWKYSSR